MQASGDKETSLSNNKGERGVISGNGYGGIGAGGGRRTEVSGGLSADLIAAGSETEKNVLDDSDDGEINFVGESESDGSRSSTIVAFASVLAACSNVDRCCPIRVVATVVMVSIISSGARAVGCRVGASGGEGVLLVRIPRSGSSR